MALERRDFIKTTTTGLAFGLVKPGMAYLRTSPGAASGEFEGGTGSLRLEGQLKAGVLKLDAREFVNGKDQALIIRGELNSINLYCAMFNYNEDVTIFSVLRDHDHSTTLVLSNTDKPGVGRLVVWHDAAAPETFGIDKEKFMDTGNLKPSILDGRGDALDLLGKRRPPDLTPQELEAVFGSSAALLEFMRGRKSTHHPAPSEKLKVWMCELLSGVPGSLFTLFWEAY
jgi:hypothetical protein